MTSREDVYHDAGKALELAQLLETEIGTALLALDALEKKSFIRQDADAYRRLLDAIDKQTLGRSLDKIRKQLNLTENLEVLFTEALDARNFLAHRFFPHHGLAILESGGCTAMALHIQDLRSKLLPAYNTAQNIASILVSSVALLHKVHAGKGA